MDPDDPVALREALRRARLALLECAAELEAAGTALRDQGSRYVHHAALYRALAVPT
jgi:hypothetical protein